MSQETIIRHCAPTLAGIKIGSLFSYRCACPKTLGREMTRANRLLNGKGIYFRLLRYQNGLALIYVYRVRQLEHHLNRADIQAFLQEQGYATYGIADCLAKLRTHLLTQEFPHEIGVFLGYPLGDIRGFMEHGGANSKCVGCWKVYTDEATAQETFARYKRCTNTYVKRHSDGIDLSQLTVAG